MDCAVCNTPCALGSRYCPCCGAGLALAAVSSARYAVADVSRTLPGLFANRASVPLPGSYVPTVGGADGDRVARLLPPGMVLNGRYRIVRLLGAGSFGRVYLAADITDPLGGQVAIKELLDTQFHTAEERAEAMTWFRREVSTLLSLRHPAIPTVHGYWTGQRNAGPLYLAMDNIPGKTLEQALAETELEGAPGGCPWRRVVAWGIGLCEVLAYLHGRTPPFVFRDLKLSNVMLDERSGAPVLIDFGIARQLIGVGSTVIGTWGYVPLEQVLGRATPRSDIYALGALLHALLTGRRPDVEYARLQRGGSDVESAMRLLFPPADTLVPTVPNSLARVLACATAFDAQDRFVDVSAMAGALRGVLEPVSQMAPAIAATACATSARHTGRCVTVCAHGDGHYTSITAAIHDAAPGTRIEVRPGLYHEALVIDKPLEIMGLGPVHEVVVESANAPCLAMQAKQATVRGLTLRGGPQLGKKRHHVVDIGKGRLLLEDCHITSGALACVAIHGVNADPVLRRCTIRHGKESGVLVYGTSQCTLEECLISGNAVGITIRRYACPTIRRCIIRDAVSYGIYTGEYAEGQVEECEIVDNGQAGVCIDHGSMLAIHRCRINRNERAIAVASNGGGTVADCDLGGNQLGAWSIMRGAEAWLQRTGNREG